MGMCTGRLLASSVPYTEADVVVKSPEVELGEGVVWDARCARLLWVDIMNAKLFRYDPATGENEVRDLSWKSDFLSSVVPFSAEADPTGDLVAVTLREGFFSYNFTTNRLVPLCQNPDVADGERFNHGMTDPQGNFWAGTLVRDTNNDILPTAAALYRLSAEGYLDTMLEGVSCSNGICWSDDSKTVYYNDTPTGTVQAFDYDPDTGKMEKPGRPCIVNFDFKTNGMPDGSAIDKDGMLWVAQYNGGRAGRYNPATGELLAEVYVPQTCGLQVTSVGFGGKNCGDLYLTTAHEFIPVGELENLGTPLAGSLCVVSAEKLAFLGAVGGVPVTPIGIKPSGCATQ
mmetsp:Transcript_24786/g.45508  ORF Transcript_24786/g.45508 Transcript_24786/m.45508 type:complete len:343 (+) Transcript_24786:80-1108(+)